jgi:hypothetical protein
LRRWVACLLLLVPAALADTVFVFSLDGLGHEVFRKAPLPTLQRLAAKGAQADGIQPAFPSTTANSHAALWTGAYGDVSGISANSQPRLPRKDHTFRDRNNGYRADQLTAEPVWVAAARQGVRTVAYQAPQVFPFGPANTHANAITWNGYQTRQVAPHQVLRRSDLRFTSTTTFHFQHGPIALRGTLTATGLRIGGIDVKAALAENGLQGSRPLARHFSAGLFVDDPVPAVIYFRLFAYSPEDLLLYVSPAQEMGVSQGDARPLLREAGGFIGNAYNGPLLNDWQAMETTELLTRQNLAHTAWLQRRYQPGLFIGYLPVADELGHRYTGLAHAGDAMAQRALAWGFRIIERWSQGIARLVGRRDHLIITADHGMTPVAKAINVNEILRRAGLGSEAVHVYNSVLLNTADWKGGTVTDRLATRSRVQAALAAYDVFTGFYTPEEHGARYGIGGATASDLYFDLKPGYTVREQVGEVFPLLETPVGVHGFRPDRSDMVATLFAAGPRLRPGTRWPRLRSIDVAPLVTTLLGIAPPRDARGQSPMR